MPLPAPRLPDGLRDAAAARDARPLGLAEFLAILAVVVLVALGYGLACLWFRVNELPLRQWRDTLLPDSDRP